MRCKEHGSSPRRGSVLPAFFCYCSLAEINPTLFEKMRDLQCTRPHSVVHKGRCLNSMKFNEYV